jgi:hypothetical protein
MRESHTFPDTARTPHAPFTSFPSHTTPFDAALSAAPRLDETDNPLASLYNSILAFVERDMKRIVDIAERIGSRAGQEEDGAVDAKGFEVLANVVWAEIARALMDELGTALFATGRPDEFRKVRLSQSDRQRRRKQKLTCGNRTTRRRSRSFILFNTLRRPLVLLEQWLRTLLSWRSSDVGSCPCISSCDGKTSLRALKTACPRASLNRIQARRKVCWLYASRL